MSDKNEPITRAELEQAIGHVGTAVGLALRDVLSNELRRSLVKEIDKLGSETLADKPYLIIAYSGLVAALDDDKTFIGR